jgi:hypothetical protein
MQTVLFGAFDRHNFGDLLFPHIVARMLPHCGLLYAGLAARDMRLYGGHTVRSVHGFELSSVERTVHVVHAGGELLTCDAWEASVMLSTPAEVRSALASENAWNEDRLAWAHSRFGFPTLAPYVLSKESIPHINVSRVCFNAVGGVDLEGRDPLLRAQVLTALKAADDVSARDRTTQAILEASGVAARLIPDPAVMVAELFGTTIRSRAAQGAMKKIFEAFPRGYATVQFDAGFGDDPTLNTIARELDRWSGPSGLGVVLFRAGAAPWHDDLELYQRVASRMPATSVRIFGSLNLWDICSVIAHSRVYCGSSLHGRIVAMAFALPRVNISHPSRGSSQTKQTAFAATWEPADMIAAVGVEHIADAMDHTLALDRAMLLHTAREMTDRYRDGFKPVSESLR